MYVIFWIIRILLDFIVDTPDTAQQTPSYQESPNYEVCKDIQPTSVQYKTLT